MIHVYGEDHFQEICGRIFGCDEPDEQTSRVLEAIPASMKVINSHWREFIEYLKGIRSFDKVYMESLCESHAPYTEDNGLMIECIRYLTDSGAKFEKTESHFLARRNISVRPKWLYYLSEKTLDSPLRNKAREMYALKRIRKTLNNGERGLFMFGAGHTGGINMLSPDPQCMIM